MAPIPPMLIRMAAAFLTTALTRRLQQSPAFFRMVDRLVHEADHFPARMQGRPVPPYINRDPQEPTIGEQAQEAWRRQVEDPGEPHDMPDPFRPSSSSTTSGPSTSPKHSDPLLQRQRAQDSFRASQKNAQKSREKQAQDQDNIRRQSERDEMRDLLEKLRQGKQ